ncbi:recombinase family protein [Mariniradius sediminis]|uniref:Recombinase family protein n=1 Tax=Mariniradius sediminis TaxID=2909237 RepID=A0ABS9BVM6_9BACT|nr:recombinase family protein [Mariniradius sediminis]MCF1751369.1 recombinase family protein [Mariniradius sediminis]
MKVKYNRVSTLNQTGDRFQADTDQYDLTLMDKVSGTQKFNERPKAKELIQLVESGQVKELVVEEQSRLGRNTGDVIQTLEWLEKHEVNVIVRNLGIQSRPNGKKNPIWKMISAVMSSLYELELENIKERTKAGRMIYVQKGGVLGRPIGSNETEKDFLKKEGSMSILKYLNRGMTIQEVSKLTNSSSRTIVKVKKIAKKHQLLKK